MCLYLSAREHDCPLRSMGGIIYLRSEDEQVFKMERGEAVIKLPM